jgi:hypothetical protein
MDETEFHPSTLEWAPAEEVTAAQMDAIARIILNWGRIDVLLNNCLATLYPLMPQHRGRLLGAVDTTKKYALIKSERPKAYASDTLKSAYKENDYSFEHLKIERDVIAHGTIMHDQAGKGSFVSTKSFYELKLSDIDKALDHSRYALEACIFMMQIILNQTPTPLRERPKAIHPR